MPTQQPKWEVVYTTDYSRLRIDKTGVYDAELDMYQDTREYYPEDEASKMPTPEGGWWERHTIVLTPCTYINGVLSDNKYHPDFSAWFSPQLNRVCNSVGMPFEYMIDLLTSNNPNNLAWAYESLASYHGLMNFDEMPHNMTDEEVEKELSNESI